MTVTIKDPKAPRLSKPSRDYIIKECVSCHQTFIEKYWDTELEWYIELNLTRYCHKCQKKCIGPSAKS